MRSASLWPAIAELGRGQGRGRCWKEGRCWRRRDVCAPRALGWVFAGRVPSSVRRQAPPLRAVSQEGWFLGPLSPFPLPVVPWGGWRRLLPGSNSDGCTGHGHRDPPTW